MQNHSLKHPAEMIKLTKNKTVQTEENKKISMRKLIFLFTIFNIQYSIFNCCAQPEFTKTNAVNTEFTKDNFHDQKAELKAAIADIEAGDQYYSMGILGYKNALTYFLKANVFNPDNALLNYKIGRCYLFRSIYKIKSISYFEKAQLLNPNVDKELYYMLGQAYQINSEWDKATDHYKKHLKILAALPPSKDGSSEKEKEEVDKKIQECKTGKELYTKPVRAFSDILPNTINSKYPEYGAILSADESVMIFTSRRPGGVGDKIEEGINEPYEDMYVSYRTNGQWSAAQDMGKPVNSDGHDATINLSPDGQTLLVYQDDKGDGNIYQCKLVGNQWSKPKKLGKNINTKYHEPSACYSFDGKTLYFVTNRPDMSLGDYDIFMSKWDAKEEDWGPPVNLGPTINTKYAENGVFMHPDGKTLYFASKGHNTMGGYDLFKSVFQNGKWSAPENLGYPVNSPDDDVFFVMNASGKRAYYTSFKTDGFGEKDLYVITFLGPEKPFVLNGEDNLLASIAAPIRETAIEPAVEVSKTKVTILKGYFKDAETLQPLEASIELIDNSNGQIVLSSTSNSATGKFLVSLPSGKNYGLAGKAEGYMFHSENFDIPESAAYKEVTKEILMKKIKVGTVIILNNIFYDYGKATLRPESTYELDRVQKVLTDNPNIKVEISGHTDSRGSDDLNNTLSANRAKAVVDYLIKKGIPAARLVSAGYGKQKLLIANAKTEDEHQQNRRTEFKIIGN